MFDYDKSSYKKTKNIKNDKRNEIVHELISGTVTQRELAEKYGVSHYTIRNWVKEFLTDEEIELIKKNKLAAIPVERNNLAKIRKCEEEYSRASVHAGHSSNDKIKKFYTEFLKIGTGVDLSPKDARRNINKLLKFITTDDFYNEYGRKYNLVDMYLTTNLQVKDLLETYYDYMDDEEYLTIYNFIIDQLVHIDNTYLRGYKTTSRRHLSCRFEKPVEHDIKDIMERKFLFFRKIVATELDVEKAYETLVDLNQKYGVKYDDVSLYIILREYINENIDSFYELGEKYKKELDLHSHVQVRCIPLLTRREKNK